MEDNITNNKKTLENRFEDIKNEISGLNHFGCALYCIFIFLLIINFSLWNITLFLLMTLFVIISFRYAFMTTLHKVFKQCENCRNKHIDTYEDFLKED